MMSRTASDWDVMVTEYKALKKQLKSKQQATQVLQQQLQLYQQRCGNYEKQLQRYRQRQTPTAQANQRQQSSTYASAPNSQVSVEDSKKHLPVEVTDCQEVSDKNALAENNCGMHPFPIFSQGQSLHEQFEELKALYRQAMDDNKLLRDRVSELQSHGGTSQSFQVVLGEKEQALQERNDLLQQLEQVKREAADLRIDLETCQEEKDEVCRERDFFREKSERLNTDLLQKLFRPSDHTTSATLDIDAMIVENRYLKERLTRCMEEKQELLSLTAKQAKHKRMPKLPLSATLTRDDSTFDASINSKQLKKIHTLKATIGDLQALTQTLSDSLKDKNLALEHLRHVNKTLASRLLAAERELGKDSSSDEALSRMASEQCLQEQLPSSLVPSCAESSEPQCSGRKRFPTWRNGLRSSLSKAGKQSLASTSDDDSSEQIIWEHPGFCGAHSSDQRRSNRLVMEGSHLAVSPVKDCARCRAANTKRSLLSLSVSGDLSEGSNVEQIQTSSEPMKDAQGLVEVDVVTSSMGKHLGELEQHTCVDSSPGRTCKSQSAEADLERDGLAESLRHMCLSDASVSEDEASSERNKLLPK